jgi:RNA-directed DNA polymerase
MNLKSEQRQNIQLELDFSSSPAGEAREAGREEIESLLAAPDTESPASTNRLMEEVCERENLKKALQQVKANKGSAGIDRMTVGQLSDYLKQHWPAIREQLLKGTYEPKPVRRVEIPKPDGGVRKLGIPTIKANCTGTQLTFGMGGDPPPLPPTARPAVSSTQAATGSRYGHAPAA